MRKAIIHSTGKQGGLNFGSEEHKIHQELIRILSSLLIEENYLNSENDIVLSGIALEKLNAIIEQNIRNGVANIKAQKVDVRYFCYFENEKIGVDSSIPDHQRIIDLIEVSKLIQFAIENHEKIRIDYFEDIQEIERKVMFILNVKLGKESNVEEIHLRFQEVFGEIQNLSISELAGILNKLIGKKMIYINGKAYISTEKGKVFF